MGGTSRRKKQWGLDIYTEGYQCQSYEFAFKWKWNQSYRKWQFWISCISRNALHEVQWYHLYWKALTGEKRQFQFFWYIYGHKLSVFPEHLRGTSQRIVTLDMEVKANDIGCMQLINFSSLHKLAMNHNKVQMGNLIMESLPALKNSMPRIVICTYFQIYRLPQHCKLCNSISITFAGHPHLLLKISRASRRLPLWAVM